MRRDIYMKVLDNFLTSGHRFGVSEKDLQYKYFLLNTIIGITVLMITGITYGLFWNQRPVLLAANTFYIIAGLFSLYVLRKNREAQPYISMLMIGVSLLVLFVDILHYPTEYMRISWFIVIVAFSFFLDGKKTGYLVTLTSIVLITILYFLPDVALDLHAFVVAVGLIVLIMILIEMYERRESAIKQDLYNVNKYLEERIQEEIGKRLHIYQESNEKLQLSAEELREQKDAYKKLAYYDVLTTLPNRTLFYDHVEQSIRRSRRHGYAMAVLFMDLDNFKEINDSLGHEAGDKVLQVVADRLQKQLRQSDLLARFGGDEFVLLLENTPEISSITTIGKKLLQAIAKSIVLDEREIHLTASVGVAIYPDDASSVQELLRNADSAMYSAKNSGFGLIHFYKKEMTEKTFEKLMTETYIRRGMENGEFELYYQPQIDTERNTLVGFEALVRWNHPQKGLLTPGSFIPVAEESILIVRLGEMILFEVAEQMKHWQKRGIPPDFISVNVSTRQLRHQNFVKTLKKTLKKAGRHADWLELEITESYTLDNPKQAQKLLETIKKMGVLLSIDDFGTGYSSLSYLKNLPVDKLKIDQSFIRDISHDKEDKALVRAIVSMANGLDIGVVAEGVETREQQEILEAIGCQVMQGYYFARPMSAAEAEKLLVSHHTGGKDG